MKLRVITMWLMGITAIILIGWDIYVAFQPGIHTSISGVIWDFCKTQPMVPFVFGVLMGHFFWQENP